ncbi:MAG: LuxR family transcriptional regulator, partial [Chloroflexi bacterium]
QLRQEKPWAAIAALEQGGFSTAAIPPSLEDPGEKWHAIPGYLLLARALLLENRMAEAMQLVETLLPVIAASQDVNLLIEAHLLLAVLLDKRNNARHARESILKALGLAEPSGILSPFLNIGNPAYEFIRREVLSGGVKSDHGQKILAAFAGQTRKGRAVSLAEPGRPSGRERLTRQEAQILHFLAQGLSSTEVAGELVIAVSTARSYIKSIHRKLNAHSREEVIARGKQLGLI